MILSLISGTLFRKPEERTSQAGKYYVSATIKVANDNASHFIRVMFFNEDQHAEILASHDGDAISVTGNLSVDVYDKGDGPRPSLTILATRLLMLKREKRQKSSKQAAASQSHASADKFGDRIPF